MPNWKNVARLSGIGAGGAALGAATGGIIATRKQKANQEAQARAFNAFNQKENQAMIDQFKRMNQQENEQLKRQYMRAGATALVNQLQSGHGIQ